jgi:hypothetical protein
MSEGFDLSALQRQLEHAELENQRSKAVTFYF